MSEVGRSKVQRALGALRQDTWSELQHRRVAKRLDSALVKRPARAWAWYAAGIAAAASVLLWVLVRPAATHLSSQVEPGLGSELHPARALLSDGSVVDIDRGGRIRVISDRGDQTQIEVLAGRAEFEVKKRHGGPFMALIRGVQVRVVGTHFSTELDLARPPGVVRVNVQRGIVEVAAPHGEHLARLTAGDSLEVSLAPQLAANPSAEESANPPSNATSPSAGPPATSVTPRVGSAAPPQDASTLFELGNNARRSGNVQAAVKAYAALLEQFPNDERAGVAALELGRLRMDSLHAYAPAAQAFRRAIAAAANDGTREDALARLIEVLDRMHDRPSCLAEQRRYRLRYPLGVHATSVERRCVEVAP
ncbi:MAG: FecR domain-containing protein [Polyangiaceae bacterium]